MLTAATALGGTMSGGVAAAAPTTAATQVGHAVLQAENSSGVSGHATLRWNPNTDVLVVTVIARGLVPGTTHPDHIHAGRCPNPGAIVYSLTNLVANTGGVAHASTTVDGVGSVDFHGGWAVNVHQGPTLTAPGGATAIACGDVLSHQ